MSGAVVLGLGFLRWGSDSRQRTQEGRAWGRVRGGHGAHVTAAVVLAPRFRVGAGGAVRAAWGERVPGRRSRGQASVAEGREQRGALAAEKREGVLGLALSDGRSGPFVLSLFDAPRTHLGDYQ